jgi:nickel-dependent lactate racemase
VEFSIPYGKKRISCSLIRGIAAQLIHPAFRQQARLSARELEKALEHPVSGQPLSELIRADRRPITIVAPDRTRAGGQKDILPFLVSYLEGCGVASDRIEILVANGTHRLMDEKELRECFGDRLVTDYRVSQHDCRNKQEMTRICSTSSGNELWINSKAVSSKFVILFGGVSFHYFAGFGGGPKLIFPGLAHYESTKRNHALTLKGSKLHLHEGCKSGQMEDNPVLKDIWEGVGAVNPSFAVNIIYDTSGNAIKVFSGEWKPAVRGAYEYLLEHFVVRIDRPVPLVIASAGGFPRDVDFVQAHKAMEHAANAVQDDGVLILAARCEKGIGSDKLHGWITYVRDRSDTDRLDTDYDLHLHLALSLKQKTQRIKIWVVSELDAAFLGAAGIKRYDNLGHALEDARQILRLPIRCFIIPHAGQILPMPAAQIPKSK